MDKVSGALRTAAKKLFETEVEVELTRPDEQFGDFATNVALQLAGKAGKPPREVAEQLVAEVKSQLGDDIKEVTIAGPGFINITLSDSALAEQAEAAPKTKPKTYKDKVVVAEYGDPNPFKILHAGHLYTDVVGDAVANVLEASGAEVHRVNYGGDVGRHVGISMWAIIKELGGENPQKLKEVPVDQRSEWMTKRYVEGTAVFEEDESKRPEILELNKRVYKIHDDDDQDSPFAQIYWTCRQWSYDYFEWFYAQLGSKFEKYYPESENAALGLQTVKEQLKKGVYEESDGAVVFRGEPYGLHTRVFITKEGLPTYETKDVGLIMAKWHDYQFDTSLIITAHDQMEYMKVVVKSIEQFMPDLASKTAHLTHGILKLTGGVKMSSRKGNILRGADLLEAAEAAAKKARKDSDPKTAVAAVKYALLKQRLGGDIIYDPEESVSMEGNSGPYLQYAHARARSILSKSLLAPKQLVDLQVEERNLARKISEYPEAVQQAVNDMLPHHICTYLYELAQTFNRFYEKNRVVGDEREVGRKWLVTLYADVLKDGLTLLNIAAPDHL